MSRIKINELLIQVFAIIYSLAACRQVPALEPPFVSATHPVCAFTAYEEKYVELPDCDPGVDPGYTYQNARRCECTTIDPSSTKYSYRPDYFVTKK